MLFDRRDRYIRFDQARRSNPAESAVAAERCDDSFLGDAALCASGRTARRWRQTVSARRTAASRGFSVWVSGGDGNGAAERSRYERLYRGQARQIRR